MSETAWVSLRLLDTAEKVDAAVKGRKKKWLGWLAVYESEDVAKEAHPSSEVKELLLYNDGEVC